MSPGGDDGFPGGFRGTGPLTRRAGPREPVLVVGRRPRRGRQLPEVVKQGAQYFTAQRVEVVAARLADVDQARLVEGLDVVRDRGLGDRQRIFERDAASSSTDAIWRTMSHRIGSLNALKISVGGCRGVAGMRRFLA